MSKIPFALRAILPPAVALALTLFSGCATSTPTVTSHPDSSVAYGDYKTFLMLRPSGSAANNPVATPMLLRQVRRETESAFVAKGLAKSAAAQADLLILVHGGVAEKLDVQDWGLSYARFGRGLGRQEISQYKEGSLFIDVFDAKTREMIWRGSVVSEVSDTPEPTKLKAAVEAIVARYPN